MNKQVKNYFMTQKLTSLYETVSHYVFSEAKAGGVKLPVTESDIEFAHQVRTRYRQQGLEESGFPQGWKIIAIKWAFLHPSPLHRFVKNFNKETNQWEIYETLRVGVKDRVENSLVAAVDDKMRLWHAQTTKTRKDDENVADWWMEEMKDCLLEKKAGVPFPVPYAKIVSRGSNGSNIIIGFRKRGKNFGWNLVEGIEFDVNKFKGELQQHGYDDARHAQEIIRMNPATWEKLFAKEQGFNYRDEKSEIPRTQYANEKKRYLSPGYQIADQNPSEAYSNLYQNNPEFRDFAEKLLIKAVQTSIGFVTSGSKVAVIKKGKYELQYDVEKMNEKDVEDILQDTRQHILNRTGDIEDEVWNNWKLHSEDILNWMRRIVSSSAKTIATKRFNKMHNYKDEEGNWKGTRIAKDDNLHFKSEIKNILNDIELLRRRPEIISNIRKQAQNDPKVSQILRELGIDLEKLEKEVRNQNNNENYHPYSFIRYIVKRIYIQQESLWSGYNEQ